MNFLSLHLDNKTRIKMTRWWQHLAGAAEMWLLSVAVMLFFVVLVMWYGIR